MPALHVEHAGPGGPPVGDAERARRRACRAGTRCRGGRRPAPSARRHRDQCTCGPPAMSTILGADPSRSNISTGQRRRPTRTARRRLRRRLDVHRAREVGEHRVEVDRRAVAPAHSAVNGTDQVVPVVPATTLHADPDVLQWGDGPAQRPRPSSSALAASRSPRRTSDCRPDAPAHARAAPRGGRDARRGLGHLVHVARTGTADQRLGRRARRAGPHAAPRRRRATTTSSRWRRVATREPVPEASTCPTRCSA